MAERDARPKRCDACMNGHHSDCLIYEVWDGHDGADLPKPGEAERICSCDQGMCSPEQEQD